MTLTHWNPVTGLATVEIDRLNHMFDRMFTGEPAASAWTPAVDIYETAAKDVVIKAELPDMKREDIKVTFEQDVLSIAGERKSLVDEKTTQIHRTERMFGSFRGSSRCRRVSTVRASARPIRTAC